MFRPKGLHHPHAKPDSDEGLWAETSAIYINYQHLADYTKENNCGNAHLDYIISWRDYKLD